jgi:hypothetical protein
MLSLVTDSSGTPFSSEVIPTATLTAASGNAIKLTQSTHLTFQIGETDVSHSFYLLDSLPIAEKMILGMDFLGSSIKPGLMLLMAALRCVRFRRTTPG